MTTRRIIQLCCSGERVHALCSDGTAWEYERSGYGWGEWYPLPDIPPITNTETINDN
jgi:hypothetical protein